MAKAIPDYAIEIRDVSDEIAALREAVEVLEGSCPDYDEARYRRNWQDQRDECARLAHQVKKLNDRINNPDWGYEACNARQAQTIHDQGAEHERLVAQLRTETETAAYWMNVADLASDREDSIRNILA
jgi:cell division septum initiation protein DivIVA